MLECQKIFHVLNKKKNPALKYTGEMWIFKLLERRQSVLERGVLGGSFGRLIGVEM